MPESELQTPAQLDTSLFVLQTNALLGELREGPPSHIVDEGSGWLPTLAQMSAGQAGTVVGTTSVAQHVRHTILSASWSIDWLKGDRCKAYDWNGAFVVAPQDASGSSLTEEQWQGLQAELGGAIDELHAAIEQHGPQDRFTLKGAVGALAHLAYHLGAVRQKLQLLPEPAHPAGE